MFTFVPARDFNAKKLCWRGKQCQVLKQALIGDGLARGLREAAKALDKRLVFVFDRNINNVNILVFSSGRPCSAYWPITVTSPCTRSLSPLSVRWIRINWMFYSLRVMPHLCTDPRGVRVDLQFRLCVVLKPTLVAGARHPIDQGRLQHEAWRVGWSLQDWSGGQGQESGQVLGRCGKWSVLQHSWCFTIYFASNV